jgi:hypothetical protein
MILRELFYFNKENEDMSQDNHYDPSSDTNTLKKGDTRKTRLTLKQINRLRRASDQHYLDQERDIETISKMYAQPPAEPAV